MWKRRTTWTGLIGLILLSAAVSAAAQPLQVAGDGTHLWVLRTEKGEIILLHRARGTTDPWNEADRYLRRVDAFKGGVMVKSLAAAPGQVWMIFDDMSVESLRIDRDVDRDRWRYVMAREVPLPQGASLKGMAAGSDGVWALLRVETAEALAQIDAPLSKNELSGVVVPRIALRRGVLPPAFRRSADESPPAEETRHDEPVSDAEAVSEDDAATNAPIMASRLLWLHNERWHKVALPEDWPEDTRAWVTFADPHDARPALVTTLPGDRGDHLRVYRWRNGTWHATHYSLNSSDANADGGSGELHVLGVGSGLMVGRRIEDAGRLNVQLTMLAPEGAVPIGQVLLDAEPPVRWAISPFGDAVAVMVKSASPTRVGRLRWTLMDLRGNVIENATELVDRKSRPLDHVGEYVVFVSALVIATLIMFVFWRRDPQWNQLDLPETLVLADPARRAMAAVVDLLPCIYLATWVFDDASIQGLLSHWPMWSGSSSWRATAPAALAIGLFVLYTTFAELFTARTIGKAIFSLRVTGLRGEPPNLWQVLLRNAMKVLELVQPLLLILPLIGPFRQRLGDLVARTVIVAPRGPDEQAKTQDEEPAADERE